MGSPDKQFQPAPPELKKLSPLAYGRMKQHHVDYDARRMNELHDLYEGGYAVQKRAKSYLRLLTSEHQSRYDDRCETTAYIGYFGQVVEQFTSDLFAQPLSIMTPADDENPKTPGEPPDDFYKEFETDCDLRGTAFVDLLKEAMTTALVQRYAYVCIDAPKPDAEVPAPATRAEEEARGDRLYAYDVSPREIIDWKEDDRGGYRWLVINRLAYDRDSPEETRDEVRETFLVWRMLDGVAAWQEFEIRYEPDKPPKDEALVTALQDRPQKTKFKRIPILRMRLPKGFWVGNIVGPAQKEHWQRRSCLNNIEQRTCVPLPYVKRGPQAPAKGGPIPDDIVDDPQRGNDPVGRVNREGFIELGSEDDIGYASPDAKCLEQIHKELDELKDEILRVVHQMAAAVKPSAGSLGRSAASKQQDGKATALVLRALGRIVREFALLVYETMADALGHGETHWVANGLDNFEVIDRQQIIEEAVSMALIDIPSETFAITYAQQIAEKILTGVDPQTLDSIRKEIEERVGEKFAQKKAEDDARAQALEDGEPLPEALGGRPPGPPPIAIPGAPGGKPAFGGKGGPPEKGGPPAKAKGPPQKAA
jgi:hypothetical protein